MVSVGVEEKDEQVEVPIGIALIVCGVVWTVAWSAWRPEYLFGGDMGTCGVPATDVFSTINDVLAHHCRHVAAVHLAVGAAGGAAPVLGGLLVIVDNLNLDHWARPRSWPGRLGASALGSIALVVVCTVIVGAVASASGSRTPAFTNEDYGPSSSPG